MIEGENQARFPFCNAFLITGAETVLIDTGIGEGRLAKLDREHRIDQVIISHSPSGSYRRMSSAEGPVSHAACGNRPGSP
ncbi:MAG: hypothetical protein R2874_09850 [Desulfobacterales bacterium]